MEEEDVRGDRGLSVFRLRAVSRLTLVVRCTEIGYSVSTQVLGFRFGCGWCCVVGFLFGCCWFCVLLLCVSAWWNRGIADEVTMASYGRAVTGTAVMARSANEEKKKKSVSILQELRGIVPRGACLTWHADYACGCNGSYRRGVPQPIDGLRAQGLVGRRGASATPGFFCCHQSTCKSGEISYNALACLTVKGFSEYGV